jgi:hypothetical protein
LEKGEFMIRWVVLAVLTLLFLPLYPAIAGEDRPSTRIAVLYTGEAHGEIHPCG